MLCKVGKSLQLGGMGAADAHQTEASANRCAPTGAGGIYRRESGLLHGAKKTGTSNETEKCTKTKSKYTIHGLSHKSTEIDYTKISPPMGN